MLTSWLAHPLTKGLDLDSPETTDLRRKILREKRFLRKIYVDWYKSIASLVPAGEGKSLEIGSGAGFLKEYLPEVITSDILPLEGIDAVVDAERLPFEEGELKAIVMNNVLHHVPDVRQFFTESTRCVCPGGRIIMVEPWVSWWSKIIYKRLHHEPFDVQSSEWTFPADGPLSGANGALPWILFKRDREQFEQEFPEWSIQSTQPIMPFRYLVSGGISLRSLMPSWSYDLWAGFEWCLKPFHSLLGMFAMIVLERNSSDS